MRKAAILGWQRNAECKLVFLKIMPLQFLYGGALQKNFILADAYLWCFDFFSS